MTKYIYVVYDKEKRYIDLFLYQKLKVCLTLITK